MTEQPQHQQLIVFQKLRPDFNSSQKLINVPLDGRNYLAWSKAAKISLKGKGLLGFINGNRPRPTDLGDAQEEWDILDGQTFTLILNSLNSQLLEIFVHYESAKELWDAITDQHSNQSNNSHIFQIKKEITQMTQGSKTVSELIEQVKSKYQELKVYRPFTTDLAVLQERDELDQIYTFLDALDLSYDSIRAQILNNTERLTFAGVTARIQQEESRRVAMSVSDQNPKSESHAFTAMNPQAFKGKKSAGQRCTHCNRDGHLREGCWNLFPHLKLKWKGQGGGGGRNQGEPPRKAYLAENLDSSQGEKKGNGEVRGSDATPTELYRLVSLESAVNRLTQSGSVNSLIFSNFVTGQGNSATAQN
jgi:gag-polypeptide of LTR copia-type